MALGAPGVPKKHGLCIGSCGPPEYRAWHGIKDRCLNPKATSYPRYGARGIGICSRWLHGEDGLSGVECFVKDMGQRPSPRHSVERIDNLGHYAPENCRWATDREQSNNTLAQASRMFGVPYARLKARIDKLGWSPERAVKESRYGV